MIKKIINLGAIYYTCITSVLLVFFLIFGGGTSILDPARFLTILLFSFVMSVGSTINNSGIAGKVACGVCHAVCYIGGFLFCVLLPYGKGFSFTVIALIIFSIIYAIVMVTKSVVLNRTKHTQSYNTKAGTSTQKSKTSIKKETEYKNLFSNDNK